MGILRKIFGVGRIGSDFVLSLDIGTEVVKALVFRIDNDSGKGVVIGVGRERQKIGHMNSGAVSDIAGVIATCDLAIEKALQMAEAKKVKQVIIGIAGELVKGVTTTVHYERARPEIRIDLPELKNIMQKVQWKAFDRIRAQMAFETGHNEIDVKLINASIVDVKIDGYRVSNPIGFQGKDVSIGVFNAYAPMVHLGALQSIAEELRLDLLAIAAEPYAVAKSMGIENNPDFGAIFIDIGGGTTDVAVVRNGGLEGTVMFGLGGRAFTKRLATDFNLSFDEAEKVKLKHSAGMLGADISSKIARVLEQDCQVWLSGLELALENFSTADLLPSRILLCGGGSGLPGIYHILNSDWWQGRLAFPKKPTIGFLQPRDVANIIDRTQMLRNPQDVTPMGLANLALEMTGGEDKMLDTALQKAVKIIQN